MSEFLQVAERVLQECQKPMRPQDIVDYALSNRMFSDNVAGKTPHQTMKAKLSVDIRRRGDQSKFIRTAPGRFYLRNLLNQDEVPYSALPLTPPKESHPVLVFPSSVLDELGRFQGIKKNWKRIAGSLFAGKCFYMDRLAAESDNSHKQILTYIMVRRLGQVLAYKRGTFNRVEEFLRGAQCIGFGGHVSERDLNLFSQSDLGLMQSALRELSEELVLPEADRLRLSAGTGLNVLGALNDDSSAVGRRHFAFVLEYQVSSDEAWLHPRRGEKSITQLRWLSTESEGFSLWNFEYWSQLCLRQFFSSSLKAQPGFRVRRKSRLLPPNVLLVLGPVGSGKSEATAILKADFGYHEINSGRVLAELLGLPPVPETPRNVFQEAAWTFIRHSDSVQRLAEAIWTRVEAAQTDRILIDGVRQRETIEALKQYAGQRRLGLVYVHTPPDIAYEFFSRRQAPESNIHSFLELRESPVEREVERMIVACDAVLYNWTGQVQYRQVVRGLMEAVGVGRR